jgi:hypothetical protein
MIEFVIKHAPSLCLLVGCFWFTVGTVWGILRSL